MAVKPFLMASAMMLSTSAYNLYPLIPPDAMSKLLGVSSNCLTVL
jgi:hypothetical protein